MADSSVGPKAALKANRFVLSLRALLPFGGLEKGNGSLYFPFEALTLRTVLLLGVIALPVFGWGCAGLQHPGTAYDPMAIEEQLRSRVLAYWSARQEGNLGLAYEYYSPKFRERVSRRDFFRDYRRLIRFLPTSVVIDSVTLRSDDNEALVSLKVGLQHTVEGKDMYLEAYSKETWVLAEATWWKRDETFEFNI